MLLITQFISDLLSKPSSRAYIAPSVYLLAGKYMTGYNYYSSLEKAVRKYNYLKGISGGVNEIPAGAVMFQNNGTAQTFGINCDFWVLKNGAWQLADYAYLKGLSKWPPIIFRFLTPSTTGPYYAVFEPSHFGMAATTVKDVDPGKLAELDAFWREVQTMKYRYNALVGFLNNLARRQLNTVEQQIFNEGMLLLNSMNQQMSTVRGIEIGYSEKNAVGAPVLLIIAAIAILGGATAYAVSTIVSEREKTKRINDSYDLQKWVATKQTEVAQLEASGQISSSAAASINQTLKGASAAATKVAEDSSKNTGGVFDNMAKIVQWGVVGLIAVSLIGAYNKSRS